MSLSTSSAVLYGSVRKHLWFFHHIYCTTAKNVLSYSSVSVALCPIPFQIPTKQHQAKLKHQSNTNHMIPPSHDTSNIMWLISSSKHLWEAQTPLKSIHFISPESLHYYYTNKNQTRFPDGHSCVLNTITTVMWINTTLEKL